MLRFVIIATVAMFAASACGVADDSSTPDPPPGDRIEFADSVSPETAATPDQRRAPARQSRIDSPSANSGPAKPSSEVETALPPSEVVRPNPLGEEVVAIASAAVGHVGIAVIDLETDAVYEYQADHRVPLASVAKVPIMLAALSSAPSTAERELISRMITQSDNLAADALWFVTGRRERVREVWDQIGLGPDDVVLGDRWGAVEADAHDVALLIAAAVAGDVFAVEVQRTARQAMEQVIAEQAWGVSAGVPESGVVGLKNGWLEDGDGWLIHSAGYVRDVDGDPRYVIVILTSDQPNLAEAVATIEAISLLVHAALGQPAVRTPSVPDLTP